MSHRGDEFASLLADLEHLHHEWNAIIFLEPLRHGLLQYRGRERPERFPPLDLSIEQRLHVGATGIAQDRAVAERAGTPFHPSLKPADDLPCLDRRSGAPAQRR